jgi:hypothetical protein
MAEESRATISPAKRLTSDFYLYYIGERKVSWFGI